ncbi:phage portal protein [Vagococcus carniphilus]|uniref:phage portal protein n=1 Tax=Vagococcus carniphilus TaxID=218144 RepID=UPI002891CE75|nr:phage portal protein [Vagococcus carniphilus]MDT2832259.1 phage portal protein [Vagococcus carniphilus]MDT2840747.1 phage portal protein [Vagococcus carniphilus]MDT2855732.1 phage portal protein [Vagococcus carniphilus]
MFRRDTTLRSYKRLRTKYSTQIEEGVFNPDDFMKNMKPFFDERERKYLAYTSERNDIDNRKKPDTKIIKVNNKLHAGLFNAVVEQAADHFTGIPIKWDYDVSEQKRSIIQRARDFFVGNVNQEPKNPEEFDLLLELIENMRFAMLDSDAARFQGACGVAFRLLEPVQLSKENWELRASNIEPWKAERYWNGAVFIREKYDPYIKKYYEEMKVVTEKTILTFNRYVESNGFNSGGTFKKTDEVVNPLNNIYLSEFKNNTNRYCDFDVAEEVADAYDRSMSDQQNEIEQFKLAYMVITGSRLDEDDATDMMANLGIINMADPQSKVDYVTKNLNKEYNEYHMNLLKKTFFTITKSIDFNDEVFKSNASGEARKWQIIALEAKTNTKEQYFKEGLKELADTIASFVNFRDNKTIDTSKVIFTFSRSLPADLGYLAEALPKLAPYVSNRTLLNQIPFVDDPDYEIQMKQIEGGQQYPDGEYDLGGAKDGKETDI